MLNKRERYFMGAKIRKNNDK
jgi:hypothetical protein